MPKVLIYRDSGADPICLGFLQSALALEGVDQRYTIGWADKIMMQSESWIKDTRLLIFPGGRDIPYHRALQGGPNRSIRKFVEDGGSYLGICAGSYYGSAFIEFEKGHPLEVIAERELKFFPGIARGSAYGHGKFCYRSLRGAQIASLKLYPSLSSSETSAAYYNGGCAFVEAENYPNTTVLGRYSEIEGQPPAIIQCAVGSGKALLCGVHPEHSSLYPASKDFFHEELFNKLQSIEQSRRELFADLLKVIGL